MHPHNRFEEKSLLNLARRYSNWSKDPRKKVGAVIVDNKGLVASLGYNHFPRGLAEDSRMNIKETKNELIIHAEQDAINKCSRSRMIGATIYVWPISPCPRCAASIIDVGIRMVVFPKHKKTSWRELLDIGESMFEEANVEIIGI